MKTHRWMLLGAACFGIFLAAALAQTDTNNIAPTDALSTTTTESTPPPTSPTVGSSTLSTPTSSSSATVSGTATNNVATTATDTNGPINLTPDQREKIKRELRQQKLDEEQRKRAADLLDKTPILQDQIHPGLTETQSIPKRF